MVNYFEKLEVQLFPEEIGDNGSILKNTAESSDMTKFNSRVCQSFGIVSGGGEPNLVKKCIKVKHTSSANRS